MNPVLSLRRVLWLGREAAGGVALLAALQLVFYMVLPTALFAFGAGVDPKVAAAGPLAMGALFEAVRLLLQNRLRGHLRRRIMEATAREALGKGRCLTEAAMDRAFWAAYLGENAVSYHLPSVLAAAVATVAIVGLAVLRLGLGMVGAAALVVSLGALARLGAHRRLAGLWRPVVTAREGVAAWVSAAVRDAGELGAAGAQRAFLEKVVHASDRWSEAESRHDRVALRDRILAGAVLVGGLVLVLALHPGALAGTGLGLGPGAQVPLRTVTDALLFAMAGPVALALARHGDGFLQCAGELEAVAPVPGRPPCASTRVLGDKPSRLQLHQVVVRYGEHLALHLEHLEVSLDKPLGIVGPNGAGKSTLAALVGAFLMPSEGQVLLDGVPLQEVDRESIAYVPQDPVLIESLTVAENMRLVVPNARDEVLAAALVELGLEVSLDQPAGQLSRGEVRRLALARAFLKEPKLVLLDEPDAWLDAAGRRALVQVLRRFESRAALVLVSHRADMMELVDTVVLLGPEHGVEAVGSPHALRAESTAFQSVLVGAG